MVMFILVLCWKVNIVIKFLLINITCFANLEHRPQSNTPHMLTSILYLVQILFSHYHTLPFPKTKENKI